MDYRSSSHISSWKFTTTQLTELRTRCNNRTRRLLIQELAKKKEQKKQQQESNSDILSAASQASPSAQLPVCFAKGYGNIQNNDIMEIDGDDAECIAGTEELPFLTCQEETELVSFYATKLFSLIGPNAMSLPLRRDIKVASTAALLLRRFYLSNSVMIYDPKIFMVACAFLATKVEDATVNVKYLEEGTKLMQAHVTIPEIIKAEIHLVAGIDYDLLCLHPYKPVEAYTEDLRTFLKSKEGRLCVNREWVGSADLRPLYEEAKRIVEELVVTDIPLIATAGSVGLAALLLSNERLIQKQKEKACGSTESITESGVKVNIEGEDAINIDFKGYMEMRFPNEGDINKVWDSIEELCRSIKTLTNDDANDMVKLKGIHKKLKKCRNVGETKKKKKKRKRDD